jgi:hypothetical protein
MATLKQDLNSNTTFMGWYGSCGEPKCENFDLSSKKDIIRTVYQFTENGKGIRTFSSNAPDFLQGFTHLKCGTSYWIVLKPGTSDIDIPEFNVGYETEESLGLISGDCNTTALTNPTPTPTPQTSRPCTKDIRTCPDGSAVGRNSNDNCRFPVCGWNADEFRSRANDWKYNEPMHYSFTFMYTGKLPNDRVRVTVRFGRIVRMQKMAGTNETEEEMSLDYNDSITDQEHFAPDGRSRILTLSQLFSWTASKVNTKDERPVSVEIKYNEELDYMESCAMTYVKSKSQDNYSIGFIISDFKEYEYKGKCPPHKKRCKDGTYVKRDPDNNCKFEDCGGSDNPTPTPDVGIINLLMKFRWLEVDEYSILQISKPLEDGVYTDYRTVYGSNVLNPKEQTVLAWQHIKFSDESVKAHAGSVSYYDMKFTFDSENENQLVVDLGQKTQFNRHQSDENEVSHLYFYRDDIDETDYKIAATFPYIIKTKNSDIDTDLDIVSCTEDAKLCDDGTVLSRDPFNNCEFPDCSDDNSDLNYDDPVVEDDGEFTPPTDDPEVGVYGDDMSDDEFIPPMDDPIIDDTMNGGEMDVDPTDEFIPPMDDPIIDSDNEYNTEFGEIKYEGPNSDQG